MKAAIEAADTQLVYLPPYSPDRNPIEQLFARLRRLLQSAAERSLTASGNASDNC